MKKMIFKILLGLTGGLLLLAAAFAGMMFVLTKPSEGPRIPHYSSPRTALLVVDIQEDYTGASAKKPYKDGPRILAATNELLGREPKGDLEVVYIQNVIDNAFIRFLAGGVNAPGAAGTEMDHRLMQAGGAPTFQKHRSDAFTNPALDVYLRAHQVDHLIIVGLDAAYCVNATARGALNRGYKVTLATRGIATESGTSISSLAERWRRLGAEVVEMPF